MTLMELITILKLYDAVTIPSSISDLKITNEETTYRYAEIGYFMSDSFTQEVTLILNELVEILNKNLISLDKFALSFKKDTEGLLHLELTHNCY